ncbi:PREDICTED: uncharacterized protein LOC106314815 [Brassica oleracea var. oleracea]|uniref:uncharacterized protein LOC106314815 n=1 Tax=Brassica oleracea var. oleracea TaxID=109376 RepID=UPI0006A6A7C1|nr:PREDICTED: uncharacterized protein LOC106314815 [Brassica oleracea var. oleracea]
MPRTLNHTHVRLIPKSTEAKTVADYRPIALCNVYYKIISKLLANRLKQVLPDLISENQSAFVQKRAITDNILISHEVLHFLKTSQATKHCSMAVKTDMSKAYDRLKWDFIEAVLLQLGFNPTWTNLIMQCIRTVSYSFLINGSAQGLVKPKRGIRQGDPLSPYIFIMCSEVLSGLCRKAQEEKCLQGIRVATHCPSINHLLFADDTLFFCRTNPKNVSALLKILSLYETASGQRINPQKSGITFSHQAPLMLKENIKTELGIEKEEGAGKYLGVPEHFGRKKRDLFTAIVDRIRQRAVRYATRYLSSVGKMTLLKSAGDRGMALVAWNTMVKSKSDGGLGFRDIQSFNDALLAKISLRILTSPSCLLARVLAGKYFHDQDFLTVQPPAACSHGWRGILIGRDLLKEHLGWAIGDGQSALAWQDSWLSDLSGASMGPIPELESSLKVAELLQAQSRDWDEGKINHHFPLIYESIKSIKPSKWGGADKRIWRKQASGIYTAKTGYYVALEKNKPDIPVAQEYSHDCIKDLWSVKMAPKLKLPLWKILHEALPVGELLVARQILPSAKCIRCECPESILHLFYHCPYAQKVWKLAPYAGDLDALQVPSFEMGWRRALNAAVLPPIGLSDCHLAPWIIASIWSTRNLLVFQKREFTA